MTNEFLDMVVKYGLGIVLSLASVYALWRITLYTLNRADKHHELAMKREERLIEIIDKTIKDNQQFFIDHDKHTQKAIEEMQEFNISQRTEHIRIIEILNGIATAIERINNKSHVS